MSIEITNNYSNYAANYADTVKKPDSKAAAEVKASNQQTAKTRCRRIMNSYAKNFHR